MFDKISTLMTGDNAAWASAVISFIALGISLRSNFISKKSYKLAREVEEYNAPTLNIYIVNKTRLVGIEKFYHIELLITNLSRLTNSVNRVELEVFYSKNEVLYSIILNHNEEFKRLSSYGYYCSSLPVNIEAGMSNKGVYYFDYDSSLLDDIKIVKYRLRITDSYGKVYTDDFTLICEEIFDGEDEKD